MRRRNDCDRTNRLDSQTPGVQIHINNIMATIQHKDNRKYNESDLPQSEQKFKGWYWCHINKQFYRWDNLPRED